MSAKIIYGTDAHLRAKDQLKTAVIQKIERDGLHSMPTFGIYCYTEDGSPSVFAKMKKKDFDECGIKTTIYSSNKSSDIVSALWHHPNNEVVSFELPMPGIDIGVLADNINIIDMDRIFNKAMIRDIALYKKTPVDYKDEDFLSNLPCTPAGVMSMLEDNFIGVSGKHVAIVGRSYEVGLPMGMAFMKANATVTYCHSKTPEDLLKAICRNADIVVSATGVEDLITYDMVKSGVVAIDIGAYDMDHKSIEIKASHITASTKCVGLYTRAEYMKRFIKYLQ